MSTDRDTTRIVRSWLDEGITVLPDRVLDAVLGQLPATPQRRTIWLARRFFSMSKTMRVGVAAVAIAAAVLGVALFVRGNASVGPPPATPTLTAIPSAVPAPLSFGERSLDPGSYTLADGFPVDISFEVPAGFVSCSSNPNAQAVCGQPSDANPMGRGVNFLVIDNVVADPCNSALLDPMPGPSVDELVAAISGLDGFEVTPAEDVVVDGYEGKMIRVTTPADASCLYTWSVGSDLNGVGPGEINELQILDVGGVRVVIATAYFGTPDAISDEGLSALRQIVDSINIETAS
jgi:hypothetical protein